MIQDIIMIKVVIYGGTGFIGSALRAYLVEQKNYQVDIISRKKSKYKSINDINYVPDVIINLAGKSIIRSFWTTSNRQKFIDSRINYSNEMVNYQKKHPNTHIIGASSIGYYGLLDKECNELTKNPNDSFISKICAKIEEPYKESSKATILRFSPVFGPKSKFNSMTISGFNYFKKTNSFFNTILNYISKYKILRIIGGPFKKISYVHIDDACGIIEHIIKNKIFGKVNVVFKKYITNEEMLNIIDKKYIISSLIISEEKYFRFGKEKIKNILVNSKNVKSIMLDTYKYKKPDFNQCI
jgi:NAD dependent epimerase/dehydratase family enzyme